MNAASATNAVLVVTSFVSNLTGYNKKKGEPDNECRNGWDFYDFGLHNGIFILKAKKLGLDFLVIGIHDASKIWEMFGISKGETIVPVIALGYAAKESINPKSKEVEDVLKSY